MYIPWSGYFSSKHRKKQLYYIFCFFIHKQSTKEKCNNQRKNKNKIRIK